MLLTPGQRLGPYEIINGIGAGGMGEVYRARDAKLNRDVALKVLPASVAGDADCPSPGIGVLRSVAAELAPLRVERQTGEALRVSRILVN